MSEKKWLLLRDDGSIAAQVITHGGKPSEEGDNPDGLREREVASFGDLASDTFNEASGRWSKAAGRGKAEKRARHAKIASAPLPDAVAEAVLVVIGVLFPDRAITPAERDQINEALGIES